MHNPFFILFSYPQCLAFSFPPFFFLRFSPLCKKHLRRDQNRDPKKGFPTSVGGAKNEEVWNAPQIWWVGWFGTFSPDRGLGSAVGLAKHYPDLIWAYEFFPFFACLFNKLLRSGFWKQDGIDALSLYIFIYMIYVYVYMCMYICVCIYVYVYMCMYICVYIYICVCVYIYMYVYVYVCVYIYIYMYVCIYIYAEIEKENEQIVFFPGTRVLATAQGMFTWISIFLGVYPSISIGHLQQIRKQENMLNATSQKNAKPPSF